MSTIEERWQEYERRYEILLKYGFTNGLIKFYDNELIRSLSEIYCGGLSASVILLHKGLSNGHCSDRSRLITLGFSGDFKVVVADIDGILLRPEYIEDFKNGKVDEDYGEHYFVERIENEKTWVYDTSVGLVFEKELYYKMQNPKIKKVFNPQETLEYLYEDFIKDANEDEKYSLTLILPSIEYNIDPIQPYYKDILLEEIESLKRRFDYEGMCEEINRDLETLGFKK